jgi:hypothetical protein
MKWPGARVIKKGFTVKFQFLCYKHTVHGHLSVITDIWPWITDIWPWSRKFQSCHGLFSVTTEKFLRYKKLREKSPWFTDICPWITEKFVYNTGSRRSNFMRSKFNFFMRSKLQSWDWNCNFSWDQNYDHEVEFVHDIES